MAMAMAQTPRDAWIEAALEVLATGGPEAVQVESLAARMGVPEDDFHRHFDDRDALVEEMLDCWEQRVIADVIFEVEQEAGNPREKLQHLFDVASAAEYVMPIELALREWSRHDPDVAARLRRIDNHRMDYLRWLFRPICVDEDDVEARSVLACALFMGINFVDADHARRSRYEIMMRAVDRLLAGSHA
jgi:AcrR family transcriptional regulator